MSTTSANGTRTRTKLSYEQNALLALAENSLKRNKKPLNVSAIVKDAERRAHEQGLELGIRARPRIKKAVEKLAEQGAIAEAPRKGRTPAEYRLTPKAVKVYNDAKSHRRSDIGIAKETLDTLKDDVERPNKRRRSSVSAAAASPPRPVQQATITKLKAELTAARSEIASLKKSNEELLDQQLDDDDDDIFDFSPNADTSRVTDRSARPSFPATHGLSFLGGRPTRPTTPELTENGSPEYDAPGEFDFDAGMTREMTPPSSSPPDTLGPRRIHEQTTPQKSEIELKMERLETSMAELALEKAQMAEEIAALKNQVEHERLNAQVDSLHGELDAIRFDKDQLQARAEADSATAGRFIAQRDATIAERDMQVAKLGADLKGKSQELFERQKQIGQLQVALAESANETKSLRSSQKATETELATSIKTIEERNGAIADLRTKDQASTKRIGELKSDLAKHKEAIEEHQDVISKLELQLERLRDIEHESLRRRRARIQAEAKRLRDEEADLTRETIDVDQWDEGLSQSRAARASLAPSWGVSPSPE
ncbi:hypothetical protein FRC09_008651 [Ceratobasidium sp. 395]|nr:hypothetical protein FRC09_008651 [Ceratobasidium sp. 395]